MTRTNEELSIEVEEIVKILQYITSNISSIHLRLTALELERTESRSEEQ